ncbi:MAG: transketolase family protein [Lachnospiraceae bacterium]
MSTVEKQPIKKIATRESYGNALVEMGAKYPNLVVLDADLAAATKTDIFKKAYPDRHIDCGIAECNMVGIAAGLATTGKIPFVSSFAMFAAGRAFEQVRNSVGYPHLNVKIGATHAGITVGEDGASHQCNEDLALMRTIPGMVVICPSDDIEARAAVEAAIEQEGPMYLRFGRSAVPIINDTPDYHFEIGKGVILREGTEVTIVATGICVCEALEAAKRLERDGISAKVINIHTIKPLDEDLIIEAAKQTGKVVTVEEHSVIGGLGSAVCDCLSTKYPTKVCKIGMQDIFGESGTAAALVQKYGLDAEGIYQSIKTFLQ